MNTPGRALTVLMLENDLKSGDVARRAGLSARHIREIMRDEAVVTPAVAAALQRAVGMPASAWLRLQANLDEYQR